MPRTHCRALICHAPISTYPSRSGRFGQGWQSVRSPEGDASTVRLKIADITATMAARRGKRSGDSGTSSAGRPQFDSSVHDGPGNRDKTPTR